MRRLRAFLVRLAGVFGQGRRDRELREELESHLEMEIEEEVRRGLSPDEARRAALIKSGGVEWAREACRDRRGLPRVESLARDVRHTVRLLARSPAFTAVALLSLAIGIGANTAIFSLVDQVILRRLPVTDPGRLQMLWTTGPNLGSNQGTRGTSYPMYQDFQQRAEAFSHVFCRYATPVSITVGTESERVMGELVSGNYFQALGVRPALGRLFTPEQDDRVYKGHPVVVLSHPYWVARFGAAPGVIGRTVLINRYPMVVVGVSAEGFSGVDPAVSPQVRVPVQMKPVITPASDNMGDRRRQWVQVFARRKPGYTLESARSSLQPLLSQILRAEAQLPALAGFEKARIDRFLARQVVTEAAATGFSDVRRSYSGALLVLMGMVAAVLLIVCFNLAGLLVARGAARRREIAVRVALGASRARLLRQMLIESAVLAAAGGALGLLVSSALVRILLSDLPSNGMVPVLRADPDWRVFAFTSALALATMLLVGLVPAWRAVRLDVSRALQDGGGALGGGRDSVRLRKALVGAQVALSVLLVSGALMFGETLRNLRGADSGFRDIPHLLSFQIDPARSGYALPRLHAFYAELLARLRSLPGVESAGYAWVQVLGGREADWDILVEGHRDALHTDSQAFVNGVSPGYWRTMGVRLLEGRDFTDADVPGRPRVAIVNRTFATRFFGTASALGRKISTGNELDTEIVGVVEDSLYEGPREGVRRQVFFPFPQLRQPLGVAFYLRAAGEPAAVFAAARRAVQEMDAGVPVFEAKSLERQLDETLGTARLTASLSAAFGILATLLAAIGLYGVVALTVARRTREIGVRMAIGAGRGAVIRMVMGEALALLAVGLAVGLPGAWLLGGSLAPHLFGVQAADAGAPAAAALLLAVVAALAALLPARRASRIDPIRALRQE